MFTQTREEELAQKTMTKQHEDEEEPGEQTGYVCRFDLSERQRLEKKLDLVPPEEREPNTQVSVSKIR